MNKSKLLFQMKQINIFLLFMASFHIVSAQVSLDLQEFYKEFRSRQFQQGNTQQEYPNIEGSPHETSEFLPGRVATKSEVAYNNVPLRFNIYSNEMEFSTEDGSVYFIAAPEIIDYVLIEEQKYIYVPFAVGSRLQRGYFKILTEGKAQLLLKQNITLRDAELPQAYKDAQPARFVRTQDDFYIRLTPSEARKVSNRKELFSILTDKNSELNNYLKKNRIRFNRSEDMTELIEYYNSLF
jgi:hypothetical protein